MTLNVDLEEVPFAIIEAVKARILANRRRRQAGQSGVRPSLRPRPQIAKIGANSRTWKLPKSPAIRLDDYSRIGHLWWFVESEPIINQGVTAGTFIGYNTARIRAWPVTIGYKRTSRLYCGNGSQYVEIEHGQQPQQMIPVYTGFPYNPNAEAPFYVPACVSFQEAVNQQGGDYADLLILPTGGDAFIVVFFAYNVQATITADVPIRSETGFVTIDETGNQYPIARCGPPVTGASYPPNPENPLFEHQPILSFTKTEQKSKVVKTFVANNSAIREISPPGALASLINAMLPDAVDEPHVFGTTFVIGNIPVSLVVANSTIPTYTGTWPSSNTTGLGDIFSYSNTAAVYYNACNEVDPSQGTPPTSQLAWASAIGTIVRPFDPALGWIVEDTSSGAYTAPYVSGTTRELFNAGQTFRYGQWLQPNVQPSYLFGDGSYYYDPALYEKQSERDAPMSSSRPSLVDPDVYGYAGFGDTLHTVWDWDDPEYCRRICTALGFQPADLKP